MTIRQAEAIPLSLPFEMGGPKPLFCGLPRQMEILLIRIETDSGLVGWGEAFGFAIWPATRAAFEALVAPQGVGQDEADIAGISEKLQRQFHILGRGGAAMYALSGLDIALWDLAGKKAGQPLSTLLGGAKRTSLPAYASLMRYGDAALVARINAGIRGVMNLPEVRERMAKMGVEIEAGTPEEFDKFIRAEYAKWSVVAKQAGVKGE